MLGFLEKPDPAEIDTDEISAGAYVLEREVARPDPARAGGLDRARGLPAAGRPGPLRSPPRGLLDGHRDAGALPAGELGHPRGHGRDRARRRRRAVHRGRRRGRRGRGRRAAGRGRAAAARSPPARSSPSSVLLEGARDRRAARRSAARSSPASVERRRRRRRSVPARCSASGATVAAGAVLVGEAPGSRPARRSRPGWRRRERRAGADPRGRSERPARRRPRRSPSICATRSGGSSRRGSSRPKPAG